jgi:hypothetical protein
VALVAAGSEDSAVVVGSAVVVRAGAGRARGREGERKWQN